MFVFILAENWLRSVDWIPQCLGVQFSASHGGSLTGTTGYLHEGAFALSVSNTTTKEQTTKGTSEGTIFRKGFSSIDERFSFLIASSTSKPITSIVVCLVSHIYCATVCVVRSYVRSSYLLHGFRLVRRLAFSVRDQWILFSNEVHAKLTMLVNVFSVQTSIFAYMLHLVV